MTRRWWGGPGISVVLHAALFVVLMYVAVQPSQLMTTPRIAATPAKFVYIVRPGLPGAGSGDPDATTPRIARARENAPTPVSIVPPPSITNVDPPPVAVPVITAQDLDDFPGALTRVDGASVGRGSGPGPGGGGRGTGMGPGEGPGAGDVYTAGVGGVSDPKLIHEVKPNYTVDAMRGKIQGVVLMEVDVLADGSVDPQRVRITRSLEPGLDREAVIAVRQWRFRPSTLLGRPVAVRVIVEIAFTLR